jgi:lipoprotein-releasing system permease protein
MKPATLFLIKHAIKINPRRKLKTEAIIMILGIIISVSVVITATNLFEGYQKTLQKVLLSSTAHIYVYSKVSPAITPSETQQALTDLSHNSEIKAINPLLANSAMVRSNKKVRGAYVRAYPQSPNNSEMWFNHYLSNKGTSINTQELIIGQNLANDLSVKIGDTITLMNPQTDKISPVGLVSKQQDFRINNIIKTGYYEMDKTLIIMTWEDALSFYNIEPQFTYLEIFLRDNQFNKTDRLLAEFESKIGPSYYLQSWTDLNSNLFTLIKMEKWLIVLVFSFLIFIAALNSVSSVSTSVIEKKRELGILKTLGMTTSDLKLVVYIRTLYLCILSIICGLALGTITSWLITLQSIYQLKSDVYFIDKITMQVSAFNYSLIFLLAAALITLCIKFPINQINRIQIIDILRGV